MTTLPAYRVLADGTDVTDRLASRNSAIEITYLNDGEGGCLTLVFDDSPEPPFEPGRPTRSDGIALPRHGVALSVLVEAPDDGFKTMGTFIVDEVELTAPPRRLIVRARSADLRGSLKERKRRHWDQTTLGAIVQRLAAEHGLDAGVAPVLATVPVPYIAQLDESDLGFLRRLGRQSGLSFGRFQHDVANNDSAKNAFAEIIDHWPYFQQNKTERTTAFNEANRKGVTRSEFIATGLLDEVNGALKSSFGKGKINDLDEARAQDLTDGILDQLVFSELPPNGRARRRSGNVGTVDRRL